MSIVHVKLFIGIPDNRSG